MRVELNKVYTLSGPVEDAWRQLKDIESVAGCMPGAEVTEKIDETHFKGEVKVRLGPVVMAFSGDFAVDHIDAEERKIHLVASGNDNKGTSSVSMDLTAFVRGVESNRSELVGDATITVNGKLASFGGRMMTQVADQILRQFADNFSSNMGSESVPGQEQSAEAGRGNEINGFKIAWNVLIGFFRSFFRRAA